MTGTMPPLPNEAFVKQLRAALQADEDNEAVYGWMVEESEAEQRLSSGQAVAALAGRTRAGLS